MSSAPAPPNVHDFIRRACACRSDRVALIDEAGAMTFGALWAEIERVGARLAQLGVTPGQGVGVLARNGRGFVIGAFAALGCDAVVMPIHPGLVAPELDATLDAAPVHALVGDDRLARLRPDATHERLALDGGGNALYFHRTEVSADRPFAPDVPDAAFVRFTSGTTGRAKGVVLAHGDVIGRVRAAAAGLGLSEDDRVVWVLPMAYHFFVSIVLYLSVGAAVVVCPDHLADTILDRAARHGGTFLYASPMHYRMLAADASGRRLDGLRQAVSVSSALHPEVARAFHARHGLPVAQAFGVIEVGLASINRDDPLGRPESIGRARPEYDVAILDEALAPVADGMIGQLAIGGPGLFSAYLTPPTPGADVLRDGRFPTGDMARRDAEGFITIVGRCKSTIHVAGHKVFAEEIAAVLDLHPQVARSRITAEPHAQFGEVVRAEVLLRDGVESERETLRAWCLERLAPHKTPHTIEFVRTIDETHSGKVRHG